MGGPGVKLLVVLSILIITSLACKTIEKQKLDLASNETMMSSNEDIRCSLTRIRWGTLLIPLFQIAAFNRGSITTFFVPICFWAKAVTALTAVGARCKKWRRILESVSNR